MPSVVIDGYIFRFYASDRPERPHMHVLKGGQEAKIWLSPVELAWNHGYNTREINHILRLARENESRLLRIWHEYFK